MPEVVLVVRHTFFASLYNVHIHALRFLFENRTNLKLETRYFELQSPLQGIGNISREMFKPGTNLSSVSTWYFGLVFSLSSHDTVSLHLF
jgi:hypothetical protein